MNGKYVYEVVCKVVKNITNIKFHFNDQKFKFKIQYNWLIYFVFES